MNLEILDLAEADILAGVRFYERQSQGVGSYFLESLYSDIESLRLFAGIHKKLLGYHRLLSRRFPYAIYYEMTKKTVRVWRVLDCRRDPHWIQQALGQSRKRR